MHGLVDMIVAVSSSTGGPRSIVRITGPRTITTCQEIFQPRSDLEIRRRAILRGTVRVNANLAIDALLYLFPAPRSYTGETLAEIHLYASGIVVEALVRRLLAMDLRPAGPGEFTARAYLNGKLDLAQAEAVNEIVSSSNRLQLDAAQRLLSGRLTQAADEIRSGLLDVLSLIEAGLDFPDETQDLASSRPQVLAGLEAQAQNLASLLAGSVQYEVLMDLPAVGIAGAPNAGKSSLLNALLGWERSIVSGEPRTTRDVLHGLLTTDRFQCVLFDCAGLIPVAPPPSGVSVQPSRGRLGYIDELAQHAAIEALHSCHTVLFCVDLSKPEWSEDVAVRALIQPRDILYVATKSDLVPGDESTRRLQLLAEAFHAEFVPVSAKKSRGLESLLNAVETSIVGKMVGTAHPTASPTHMTDAAGAAVLIARHRQAIEDAIAGVREAAGQIKRDNDEVAVTMLRTAIDALCQIEQQPIDEQVLDRIFSRFCIGK